MSGRDEPSSACKAILQLALACVLQEVNRHLSKLCAGRNALRPRDYGVLDEAEW
jgi:hypothetical protein